MRKLLVLVLPLLLACGNIQAVARAQPPGDVRGLGVVLAQARPTAAEVGAQATAFEDRSIFFAQTKGGSAALGLAFGPLGVLANDTNIQAKNKQMASAGAQSGLFELDAREEALAVLKGKLAPSGAQGTVAVQPYLFYAVVDEGVGLETVVAFRAQWSSPDASNKWLGVYAFYVDEAIPMSAFTGGVPAAALVAHREKVRSAFAELYELVLSDLMGNPPPDQQLARIRSRLGSAGFGMGSNISRNAADHLVSRYMWGDFGHTYNAVIFGSDRLYTFEEPPVPRT